MTVATVRVGEYNCIVIIIIITSLITLVPFDIERQNSAGNTCGERCFSRGHLRSYRKGAGPKCFQLWGFPSKFDVITRMQRGQCSNAPQFCFFFLFIRTPFVTDLPNVTW